MQWQLTGSGSCVCRRYYEFIRAAGGMGKLGAAHGLGFIVGPAIGGIFRAATPKS